VLELTIYREHANYYTIDAVIIILKRFALHSVMVSVLAVDREFEHPVGSNQILLTLVLVASSLSRVKEKNKDLLARNQVNGIFLYILNLFIKKMDIGKQQTITFKCLTPNQQFFSYESWRQQVTFQ
jgi:hypothetical protein